MVTSDRLTQVRRAVALAAAAIILTATATQGHVATYANDVRVTRLVGTSYTGRVTSDVDACVRHRKVILWHASIPPFKIGQTFTTNTGSWKINGPVPSNHNDKVYAVIKRKTLVNNDTHTHRCAKDTSPKVTVNSLLD
jgi:hypothetical protein